VKSDPRKKTVFTVTLPIIEGESVEVEEDLNKIQRIVSDWLPSELDLVQEIASDDDRPSLLIVDDEPEILSFLNESLKSKYNIRLASNGEEALKKILEKHPQLVISDVMMPKMNGLELCENIKSNIETCHIPVILLTVMGDEAKKIEGFELGADVYITKPFSIKHLEVRIKRLIENKQQVLEYFSRNSVMPAANVPMDIPSIDKQFLEKVNTFIEDNMSNSAFGVEELGVHLGMSTSSFFRRLKSVTGQAPSVYLRNFRLQKAAELLRENPTLNANEVMFEIGIESTSYYSASFKKLHGVSPSEFVKQ
jgi:DNA-binding response OmpR family regulator